jgi:hypothetical protein
MDSTFYLKLFLSFLIGGSWVILATYLADKLGAKIGGLIAGLPSTLLFGLLFLGWTQSPSVAVQATTIVPLIGGINGLFLVVFVALAHMGLVVSLGTATIVWGVLSYLALMLHVSFATGLMTYVVTLGIAYLCMEHLLKVQTVKGSRVTYSTSLIVARGILSGLVIALTVYLGKVGGPALGGMSSMFPAMFITTIVIAYLTHGTQFATSLAKSTLLSAASVVMFAVVIRYTYLPFGIILGTLISTMAAATTGYAI